tara:strand:- start:279 stop:557 length:279 start_codon:yes stop_codon:yes gene_type:complete
MGGSVGDALSVVTKPLEQVAKTATDAVGATPLGGMMAGKNPLDMALSPAKQIMEKTPLEGALGAGMGMVKKKGMGLAGGSLLTRSAKKAMMG